VAQVKDNLVIFPLVLDESLEPGYLLLDEALELGLLEVTEASPGGIVGEVLVRNMGEQPVLILDGEILVGAKQNRMVNTSVLSLCSLPPQAQAAETGAAGSAGPAEGVSTSFSGPHTAMEKQQRLLYIPRLHKTTRAVSITALQVVDKAS